MERTDTSRIDTRKYSAEAATAAEYGSMARMNTRQRLQLNTGASECTPRTSTTVMASTTTPTGIDMPRKGTSVAPARTSTTVSRVVSS